ncbi:mediator of RNA polymerase II transcription subunit 20 [Marchantia polymorpha subsp. ruderalis]|uniref:Mediator of RNA polymerase II transcription subunit 20 n=3 Tax=Marchantia polymorpha TaxID=3197 RepID=A0AAF6BP50_MARPO|nr:hypothetical protein MARPO_0097s0017 [Marchantia polymorpha]BBN13784.1 hypothetical protein Mp_6g06270 [Marchantia polymorpha subsp. ruderalis]|eukprot:PTQ32530.1 hypothetical protein MARPO_0097s0017 [Marchantia polymorpha]
MPVKWLLYWQPSTGSTVSSQTLVDVMKSIESINGVRTGRWQVTASNHRPIQRDQSMGLPQDCARELLGLTFSEVPSKHYFILRGEHMVVEAHANMQNIMEKLQLYRNRLNIFFEGFQYQLGDFQLKAGRAVLAHSENLRGIVLEVEYVPVSSLEQTRLLLQEFVEMWQEVVTAQNMAGRFTPLEPNYSDYNLPDQYSWQHTALQYVNLMVYFLHAQRN